LKKHGVINLCRTDRGLEHEVRTADLAREMGLVAEVVDATRAAVLYGDLRMNVVGGVYYPQDCFLSPNRFMSCLRKLVSQQGVQIVWETESTSWRLNGPRIVAVRSSQGEHTADEFVICAGSWSPRVANGLDIRIPIEAGKGYSLTISNPPRLPSIAAILSEARVAVTPMGNKLRFGGTMEIAGLDESVTQRRVDRIIAAACTHFPDFTPEHFKGIAAWRGLRPVSPDGLPYVGRVRRYENLSIAAGHAMMGFSLGPVTGKLIAETIAGEQPSIGIGLLSPDRFN
jgi:D-amino-acid dehydrogenase